MQPQFYSPPGVPSVKELLPGLVADGDAPLTAMDPLTVAGPDGQVGGRLWHFDDIPDRLTQLPTLDYRPERQHWKQIGGTPLWIGTTKGNPVTSEDLLRNKDGKPQTRFEGNPVVLHDENREPNTFANRAPLPGELWTVPNQNRLPCVLDLDETGEIVNRPQRQHELTYQRMAWAFDQCCRSIKGDFDEETPPPSDRELMEFVGEVLGLNYRINWQIGLTLGSFTSDEIWVVIRAATDPEAINTLLDEIQKKTEVPAPSGSDSSAGDPDS